MSWHYIVIVVDIVMTPTRNRANYNIAVRSRANNHIYDFGISGKQ